MPQISSNLHTYIQAYYVSDVASCKKIVKNRKQFFSRIYIHTFKHIISVM